MAIRIGIIGLSASPSAWTSKAHIEPLRAQPALSSKYTLTALATSSAATAALAAKKWGLPLDKAYSTPEAIAADPDVDLVVVGVKLPLHRELVLPALRAGKDVFVEWPLANGAAEIEELVRAAKDGKGRNIVGLQARCSSTILKAKEIIDSGLLGRIISTDIFGVDNMLLYLPPNHDYEHNAKNGANITTIAAGHLLDAMCFLLGEFASLTAHARCMFPSISTPHHAEPFSRDAFDTLSVQGILESGAAAAFHVFSTTSEAAPSITWTITGEKGSLRFDGIHVNIQMVAPVLSHHHGSGSAGSWVKVETEPPMAFGQVGELYSMFANGEKVQGCLVDFEGAALRHRMLEACFKSSRDGTRETYAK